TPTKEWTSRKEPSIIRNFNLASFVPAMSGDTAADDIADHDLDDPDGLDDLNESPVDAASPDTHDRHATALNHFIAHGFSTELQAGIWEANQNLINTYKGEVKDTPMLNRNDHSKPV
ncbi:uncharacterized protein AB675_3244, partial [Cyphellophora attinorum]